VPVVGALIGAVVMAAGLRRRRAPQPEEAREAVRV
jgi:hypothetical protein